MSAVEFVDFIKDPRGNVCRDGLNVLCYVKGKYF